MKWKENSTRIRLFKDKSNKIPDLSWFERHRLIKLCGEPPSELFDATIWLHAVYHIGAVLMNKGQADGEFLGFNLDKNIAELLKFNGKKPESGEEEDRMDPAISKTDLLEQYFNVMPHYAKNGHHIAKNPLHAVFIIKIALDHFPPVTIYNCYKKISREMRDYSPSLNVVTLSDHSQLVSADAVTTILGAYIAQNLDYYDRFSLERKRQFSKQFENPAAYRSILGDPARNGRDCMPALKALLSRYDYGAELKHDGHNIRWSL